MHAGDPLGSPLLHAWIPALEVAEHRLRRGARVAEVGVASVTAAIALAFAYPESTVHGFDPDADAVAAARERIARAGLSDRVTYEAGPLAGSSYDIVRVRARPAEAPDSGPARDAGVLRTMLGSGGIAIESGAHGTAVRGRSSFVPGW